MRDSSIFQVSAVVDNELSTRTIVYLATGDQIVVDTTNWIHLDGSLLFYTDEDYVEVVRTKNPAAANPFARFEPRGWLGVMES